MKKLFKIGFVAVAMLFAAPKLFAQISIGITISAHIAPPELPVYTQPPCPVDGYLWQPGYWAWDPDVQDYYWVPGVWVAPPQPGYLWTPAYWGYDGGVYGFHAGYWGPHVGFYGGINYGGGYVGVGFVGGGWSGGHFRYNTAVVNVNRTVIHNTYVDNTVIVNHTVVNNHVSFNGGSGGVQARPRPEEMAAERDHHVAATSQQESHQHNAMQNKAQFSKANNGRPANVSMNKVGGSHFNAQGARAAQSRPMQPAGNANPQQQHNNAADHQARPTVNQTNPERNNPADNNKPDNHANNNAARPANQQRPENQQRPANMPSQQHVQQHNNMQQHPQQQQHMQPQQHAQPQQHNAPRPQQQHEEPRPAEKEHH